MKIVRKAVLAGAFLAVAGTWTLTAAEKSEAAAATDQAKQEASAKVEPLPQTCLDTDLDAGKTEAMKGGKPTVCCDPALQPGACGNPFCFEGATCCSDGVWRCNQGNGKPVCSSGKVCGSSGDPCGEPCDGKGVSCSTNEQCCSGTCGKNGRCR